MPEQVSKITIVGKTEGVKEATADVKALNQQVQATATVTDIATRSSLSIEQAYQRQTMRLDAAARAQAQFNREVNILNKALQAGIIDAPTHAARMDLINKSLDQTGKSAKISATSLTNMSFQLNDIVTGLAMGQSPFMVMAQQGGQVFQIWQLNNNVFKEMATVLRGLINPTTLVVGAVAAVGVGAFLAYNSFKNFAFQLDDTAKKAGVAAGVLDNLRNVAAGKGIGREDFSKGIEQFSQQVYQANINAGSLSQVLSSNNMQAHTFTEYFNSAAQIISRVSDGQKQLQLLQQMGLPPTREWVRLLQQVAENMRTAKTESTALGDAVESGITDRMRELEERVNRFTNTVKNNFLSISAIVTNWTIIAMDKLEEFSQRFSAFITRSPYRPQNFPDQQTPLTLQSVRGRIGLPGGDDTINDQNKLKIEIGIIQQRLGLLGNIATVDERISLLEKEIRQSEVEHVQLTSTERANIIERNRVLFEMATLQGQIAFEQRQVTRGVEDQAIAQRLVGQGLRDDITNMNGFAASAMRATQQMQAGKDAFAGLFTGITSDIRSGRSIGDILSDRIGRFADRIFDAQVTRLVNLFSETDLGKSLFGGLGGLLNTSTMNVQAATVIVGGAGATAPVGAISGPFPLPPTGGLFDRSRLFAEMDANPALRAKFASMIKGEVGYGDITQSTIEGETALNRANARGISMEQALLSVAENRKLGYYASDTYGHSLTAADQAKFDQIYNNLRGGSNVGQQELGFIPTGNASGSFAANRAQAGMYGNYQWRGSEMFVTEKADMAKITQSMNELSKSATQSSSAMTNAASGATDMTASLNGATNGLGDFSSGLANIFKGGSGITLPGGGIFGGTPDFGIGNVSGAGAGAAFGSPTVNFHVEDHAGVTMTQTKSQRSGGQTDIWMMVRQKTAEDIADRKHNKPLAAAMARPAVPG